MKKRLTTILVFVALLCIAAFVLVYTRPLTLRQRYPVIDISQCVQIRGFYSVGTGTEDTEVSFRPGEANFDALIEVLQTAAFRTKLMNIFPQGTKTHLSSDDDFRWELIFRFKNVSFPSGDTGSGDMLQVNNFYGDIDLSFNGEQVNCSVKNQELFLEQVLVLMQQHF